MKLFWSYFRSHISGMIAFFLCCAIFLLVFTLCDLRIEAVLYGSVLSAVVCLTLFGAGFFRYYRKCMSLRQVQKEILITTQHLPAPRDMQEQIYQELLEELYRNQQKLSQKWQMQYSEMMEYYTAWTHQMKTPIAAMQLHLQAEDTPENRLLLEDLQRIEQYVEMVLCYLRLDSDSTDYLFASYDLDGIVRQAVRRFSSQFIHRKIRLEYAPLHCQVLTDEKWLLFVLEQVLSNALKYTPSGGTISIFLENPKILCIRDTGIGIAAEDLPRIFEKGFTGCNGRTNKKASGIGLYLCRRICRNLNHTITAESQAEQGTTIRIGMFRETRGIE